MIAFIIRITRITNGSTNAVVLSSPSSNNASTWTIENQAWQIKNMADVADQWIADVYVQLINLLQQKYECICNEQINLRKKSLLLPEEFL